MQRNISTDDIYYYIPKVNSLKGILSSDLSPSKNNMEKRYIFTGLKGSSSFDYMNYINVINPKLPTITNTFLTKNLRNKNSLNNIKNNMMLNDIEINPLNKLKLSHNSHLFQILNKTLDKAKYSLKNVNNKEVLGFPDINSYFNNIINRTTNQFKNFYIKNSLSIENNNKINYSHQIVPNYILSNEKNEQDKINNNMNIKKIINNKKKMNRYNIDFLYNQIFPKFFFEHHSKYNVVDNKLNIFYAENDAQFNENLIKKNKKLKLKGKSEKKLIINTKYITDKLLKIKRKIGFVKGISDYSIPSIILEKVKIKSRQMRLNKGKKKEFILPFEEINYQVEKIEKLKTKILSETMIINNKKQEKI